MSDSDPSVYLICKPEADTQGRGIFLAKSFESMQQQVEAYFKERESQQEDNMNKARKRIFEQE